MHATDGRVLEAETIIDVLLARARDESCGGFSFLEDGEVLTESLSWPRLAERVLAISSAVRSHAGVGDRAILFFRPGLDFLLSFLGCLHSGVIPVASLPPSRPLKRSLERIDEVARVSRPSLVLASGKMQAVVHDLAAVVSPLALCPVLDPSNVPRPDAKVESRARRDAVAFLQFTSGSTSAPRGVVITHANLMNNLQRIHENGRHDRSSISVTWLPVFHDMGLVDGMLEPIFGGFRCVAMPPVAFLQKPVRWLRAISRYRATHSGGPNFAFDLCVERISPREITELDLTSWRVAHDGAEPIRPSTLDAFARKFAPAGFCAGAFHPCYGLAEATLCVASGSATRLHPRTCDADALERGELRDADALTTRARTIASSGVPFADIELVIVDPDSLRAMPDGEIGEIWLAGPSVAAGYYGDADATKETFGGRTQPDDRGPFLRTGDLGFVRGGELYVVGRRKDMIILSGRNIYPQDIERSAESASPSIVAGGAVAFAVDDGHREHLTVLVENERRSLPSNSATAFRDVIDAVRRAIGCDHQVDASVIAVVPVGTLLKTSSGKIRRQACKRAHTLGKFEVLERLDLREVEAG